MMSNTLHARAVGARPSLLALLAGSALSCASTPPPAPPPPAELPKVVQEPPQPESQVVAEESLPPESLVGWDPSALDRAVKPCDDFYKFACGGWAARTKIPEDRPAWTRSFSEINERNEMKLKSILDRYAGGEYEHGDENARKVGDFYAACMDEGRGETASRAALTSLMRRIDAAKDPKSLARTVAELHQAGVGVFFDFDAGQDFKDATLVTGQIDQGGLGLPDRDYYLKDDAASKELRKKYVAHVARLFELAGEGVADAGAGAKASAKAGATKAAAADAKKKTAAAKDAEQVLALETALAKVSMTRVDRRDPKKVYHRIERAGLEKAAPKFAWKAYFETLGVGGVTAMNVAVPEFFTGLSNLVAKTRAADLQTYMRWHVLHAGARTLGKAFVDEDFAFNGTTLQGTPQILPRWKRCASAVDAALGEALAQPFVAETFGEDGKHRSKLMIEGIEKAFEGALPGLAWMDADTRAQAVGKAQKIFNKVGYPDKWRDYGKLEIDRGSYLGNATHAAAFDLARRLAKIGKPVDRAEWGMTPPTVNAYYNPQLNEMVFPAGILQPPFFVRSAADVVNFGGIGMVMGHELTHGFDDQGRQFDADGNMRDWWTAGSGKAYTERAECLVKQYDGYVAVADVHVNGKLTLGENIADGGGLKLAYAAQKAARANRPAAPRVAGFDEDQQFFIAFAQGWCSSRRESFARMLATVDPHAPPEYRVNGAIVNTPAFASAFSCSAGAPMNPPNRCAVW